MDTKIIKDIEDARRTDFFSSLPPVITCLHYFFRVLRDRRWFLKFHDPDVPSTTYPKMEWHPFINPPDEHVSKPEFRFDITINDDILDRSVDHSHSLDLECSTTLQGFLTPEDNATFLRTAHVVYAGARCADLELVIGDVPLDEAWEQLEKTWTKRYTSDIPIVRSDVDVFFRFRCPLDAYAQLSTRGITITTHFAGRTQVFEDPVQALAYIKMEWPSRYINSRYTDERRYMCTEFRMRWCSVWDVTDTRRTVSRTWDFKEELMAATWHPSRLLRWCLSTDEVEEVHDLVQDVVQDFD